MYTDVDGTYSASTMKWLQVHVYDDELGIEGSKASLSFYIIGRL